MSIQQLSIILAKLEDMRGTSDDIDRMISLRQDIREMIYLEQAHEQCATCRNGALEVDSVCRKCRNWSAESHDKPLLWKSNLIKNEPPRQ